MPARRRHRNTAGAPTIEDPIARFGSLLKASAERERAERERKQQAKRAAAEAAKAAADQAEALDSARRDLQRAIAAVKAARSRRSGVAEADASWRAAKARLIELETGAAPAWADRAIAGADVPGIEADADTAGDGA